jgi:hypothetical protein
MKRRTLLKGMLGLLAAPVVAKAGIKYNSPEKSTLAPLPRHVNQFNYEGVRYVTDYDISRDVVAIRGEAIVRGVHKSAIIHGYQSDKDFVTTYHNPIKALLFAGK